MKRSSAIPVVLAVAAMVLGAFFLVGCEDEVASGALGGIPVMAQNTEMGTVDTASDTQESTPAAPEGQEEEESTDPATSEPVSLGLVNVDALIAKPDSYLGKVVTVKGTILSQCIRGCRFSLDDGTGVVNIELLDEALEEVLMKGSVGRVVQVTGLVDHTAPPRIIVEDRGQWSYVEKED